MYVRKWEYSRVVKRNKELEDQNRVQYDLIKKLLKENEELKAELEPYKVREAIQKSNDASIIRVDDTIRINEKWEVVDENGNRVWHTTFYYAK